MKILEQLYAHNLNKKDTEHLDKIAGLCIFGEDKFNILNAIIDCTAQYWRGIDGNKQFNILTQIYNHRNGAELYIWGIYGNGYIKNINKVYHDLLKFGKQYDIKYISGKFENKAFERVYKSFANNMKSYKYSVLEVQYDRT